jgi:hypothetical protein
MWVMLRGAVVTAFCVVVPHPFLLTVLPVMSPYAQGESLAERGARVNLDLHPLRPGRIDPSGRISR